MISFFAAQYGSVSDIELVWTLVAAFGMAFSIYNVREAAADLGALRSAGIKNGRLMLAKNTVRSEVARLTIQVIFLAIGLLAMTMQDSPDTVDLPLNVLVTRFVLTWGLIIASALISLKSFWAYQVRMELKRTYGDPQDPNSHSVDIDSDREALQDRREVLQDEREERQDAREVRSEQTS